MSTKELDDDLSRVSMRIFARLIRSGCAMRSPVKVEIFVLSEDSIVPSNVAPWGSAD